MPEMRVTDRSPTNMPGRLVTDRLDLPCTILDLSPSGARLQVQPGMFLPKQLMLRASELGADRPVHVVWRNRTQLGVQF